MEMNVRRGNMRMGWSDLVKCSKSIYDFASMLAIERFKEKVQLQYNYDDGEGFEELGVDYGEDGEVEWRSKELTNKGVRLEPEVLSKIMMDSYKEVEGKVKDLHEQYARLSMLLLNLGMI